MLDIFEEYATDEAAELTGAWVPFKSGVYLLLAREGNPAFIKLLNKVLEQNASDLAAGDDKADKLSRKLMGEVMSRTVLLGWRGPMAYKGKELSYSIDNAEMLLSHKDFRVQVSKLSSDMANFKLKTEKAQAKN